jgi:hypothetical protein
MDFGRTLPCELMELVIPMYLGTGGGIDEREVTETLGLGNGEGFGEGTGEEALDDVGERLGEGRGKSWSSSSSWIGEDLARMGRSLEEISEGLEVDGIDNKEASCRGGVLDGCGCIDGATSKGKVGGCLDRLRSSPALSIDLRRFSTSSTVMENTDDLLCCVLKPETSTVGLDMLIVVSLTIVESITCIIQTCASSPPRGSGKLFCPPVPFHAGLLRDRRTVRATFS